MADGTTTVVDTGKTGATDTTAKTVDTTVKTGTTGADTTGKTTVDTGTAKTGADTTGKTAADTTGADTTQPAWGATWREDYAGENADLLTRLQRYQSPKAAIDALIAAQNKVRTGELKGPKPGKDASAEEIADWRQANDVPAEAGGYVEKHMPKGITIRDDDKALVEDFAATLHAENIPAPVFQAAMRWFGKIDADKVAARVEKDTAAKNATDDALHAEWGPDYRRNSAAYLGYLQQLPDELGNLLSGARLRDGTPLESHPGAVKWLTGLALENNPAATLVPGDGGKALDTIEGEISMWKGKMADRNSDYNTGPNSSKNRARYRELLDARDRMQGKKK